MGVYILLAFICLYCFNFFGFFKQDRSGNDSFSNFKNEIEPYLDDELNAQMHTCSDFSCFFLQPEKFLNSDEITCKILKFTRKEDFKANTSIEQRKKIFFHLVVHDFFSAIINNTCFFDCLCTSDLYYACILCMEKDCEGTFHTLLSWSTYTGDSLEDALDYDSLDGIATLMQKKNFQKIMHDLKK